MIDWKTLIIFLVGYISSIGVDKFTQARTKAREERENAERTRGESLDN